MDVINYFLDSKSTANSNMLDLCRPLIQGGMTDGRHLSLLQKWG